MRLLRIGRMRQLPLKPRVAITVGDPSGIGPEIAKRATLPIERMVAIG